jgi:hypothetical protein
MYSNDTKTRFEVYPNLVFVIMINSSIHIQNIGYYILGITPSGSVSKSYSI